MFKFMRFYMVANKEEQVLIGWQFPDLINPGGFNFHPDLFYNVPGPVLIDPIGPVINPGDPLISNPSFPRQRLINQAPLFDAAGDARASDNAIALAPAADSNVNPMMMSFNLGFGGGEVRFNGLGGRIGVGNVGIPLAPIFATQFRYRFHTFYHPYVCLFIRELNRDGIDGLLQRPLQLDPDKLFRSVPKEFFKDAYAPTAVVVKGDPVREDLYPINEVDFSYGGAYAIYNWELFFHTPMFIADRLSKNQRFEEAMKWFHYVFDPTDTSSKPVPDRYWRTKPFHLTSSEKYHLENIPNLLRYLADRNNLQAYNNLSDEMRREIAELPDKVLEWRKNPFRPHLIARMRTTAYQKNVVMKYLDNLIAWGDQLFRRDTIESINEATQLYILAAEMLGRRPEEIPPRAVARVQTYNSIEPELDEFSNALVQIEEFVLPSAPSAPVATTVNAAVTLPTMLYFCVPKNDKLLGYWDTVADRLFKIRHCMNIEGVVRQLPLFEPPIDPALLVKAVAAGIDISSALNDINAALPHYRFNVMAQKASELCAEVKALGAALLSALEKRDAEALALLRSTHEIGVLNAVRQVREKQIDDAKQTLDGLKKSRDLAVIRRNFYESREFMNTAETAQLSLMRASLLLRTGEAVALTLAGGLHLIPNIKIGSPFSVGATYGGENVGQSAEKFGASLGRYASLLGESASMAATIGSHQRRMDDWKLQERLAAKEIEQTDKQIAAAEIRLAIAEQELKNHDLQIENAKEVDEFMRDKFTNRELYDWMVGQISAVYFQSYQLVYDVAKRAERAYRHELGLTDSSFIQFGYWDSLKKGLLAGERLYHDIKRMEVAYLDQNKREYEIARHISLAMLDPVALVRLRETGECFVDLPETLFDMDYPGHYMRRIKTVGLTIPCVVGPYTSINCTLTLLANSVRRTTSLSPEYARSADSDDPRFADNIGAIQSIATSSAQNDSGMFELNFRDERYLPFEGAGAISRWRIELPIETNQFDRSAISDVVIHLRYTAREGGAGLKAAALESLPMSGARLFSLRHEFPTEWHRFLHPDSASNEDQKLEINLTADRFPFRRPGKQVKITRVELFGRFTPDDDYEGDYKAKLTPLLDEATEITMSRLAIFGGLHHGVPDLGGQEKDPGNWKLRVKRGDADNYRSLPASDVDDIFIVCSYRVASE